MRLNTSNTYFVPLPSLPTSAHLPSGRVITVGEDWLALPQPRTLQARTIKSYLVKGRISPVTLYMKLPSRNIRLDTCSVPSDMKEDVRLIFWR